MAQDADVTIIGGGPYGLSPAAHLHARGVKYRIFGDAMRFWRDMPVGVNMKSLAFATNISVPKRGYSFPQWCLERGLEDFEPCTMQSFAAYGCEMQRRFAPDLEQVFVTNAAMRGRKFEVTLASGDRFNSRKVVSCTGLSGLPHVPSVLQNLGRDRMRHTSDISDYSEFRNKAVAVIGAGASTIEASALVLEAGGSSEVFVRGQAAVFHGRSPRIRPLWERIKNPTTVLGTSRSGWVLQHLPLLVHMLPRERRTRFVKGHLHFIGPLSFMCFGPLFRFVTGAQVAAPRLARRLGQ